VFLFCALVLGILVSISLPFLPALDFVRVHFGSALATNGERMTELRVRSQTFYFRRDTDLQHLVWYMVRPSIVDWACLLNGG
jgi:hypothetical protein